MKLPAWSIRANQFDQMHVPRRIKEVHAEKVRAKIFRAPFGQKLSGMPLVFEATTLRAGDAAQLFRKSAFDVEVLDHCFDDQINIFSLEDRLRNFRR
jgi:hypothetical protein